MKIGTFMCWLFGHKFLGHKQYVKYDDTHPDGVRIHRDMFQTDYCIRCGIDKEVK